jgi:benzoylformate decarboxylase
MNVMESSSDIEIPNRSRVDRRPIANSLEELAEELAAITPGRVAIIAGDEISNNDAYKEVVDLAEILAAPVFGSSWPAHIPYPTSHYLWQGNLPTKASDIAEKMQDFDCVFALGGKSFITILYSDTSALPNTCELFQLSVDGGDLGRTYPSKLSVVGDIQFSLKALNRLLVKKVMGSHHLYEVQRHIAKKSFIERRHRLHTLADSLTHLETIHPLVAARALAVAIGSTPIVDEALATATHLRKFLSNNSTRQYSFLRGGALGWGMPAAVGFSLGLGKKPVVSLVGDGAAMYSPQALWTAVHEELPVTFIVMNNQEYNILKKFMRSQPNYVSAQTGKFIAMDINKPAIDFLALAKSMGMAAQRIHNANDIDEIVSSAIASNRPNLIEIIISCE